MRQALNPLPTLNQGALGVQREKNVGSALGVQNEGRGWEEWARSQAGNGRRTPKTLTHILVERIGGKERHVRCVPRCPPGLPLGTAAVRVRRRKEAPQVQKRQPRRPERGPSQPLLSPTPATQAAAAATAAEKLARTPRGARRESRRPERCPRQDGPGPGPSAEPHAKGDASSLISRVPVGLAATVLAFLVPGRLGRTGSFRRAEADYTPAE